MTDPADITHAHYEAALLAGTDLLDSDAYWRGVQSQQYLDRRAQVERIAAAKRRELSQLPARYFSASR